MLKASILVWISWSPSQSRNNPPVIRMMSRHDSDIFLIVMNRSSADQRHQDAQQQDTEHQRQRQPIFRARDAERLGMRDTITDRKMTLSMPSTISSAVNVSSVAEGFGAVSSSIMP